MKTLFCIIIFIFICGFTFSQEHTKDSTIVYIETIDGNEFFGKIIEEDDFTIKFKSTTRGEIQIQKKNIKKRETQDKKYKYLFPNPYSFRYLWTHSGYGLKKGNGYYQNINTLWNHVSIGISDNLSLGLTAVPITIFNTTSVPVMLTPKVSIPIKENALNLGFGATLGTVLAEDSDLYGLLYGTSTIGSRDNNISIGISYGFVGNRWTKKPITNFSFMARTSNRVYFISENYFLPGGNKYLSIGGRAVWEKVSLNYIGVFPLIRGFNSLSIIPVVSLVVPFGKKIY